MLWPANNFYVAAHLPFQQMHILLHKVLESDTPSTFQMLYWRSVWFWRNKYKKHSCHLSDDKVTNDHQQHLKKPWKWFHF